MNIAIVGPSPVPFSIGGMEYLQQGLTKQINELTAHNCELIKLPCRENSFWDIIDCYKMFYMLDLSHFDMVISIKYPAWMVRHRNHICYMAHRLRGFYDTFHFLNMPDNFNTNKAYAKELIEYIDSNKYPKDLEKLFYLVDELRLHQRKLPPEYFSFPNPFIRKIIRYMDDYALSENQIKRYFAISKNVKNRDDYFPKDSNVDVIYPPSSLNDFQDGDYDYLFTASRLDGPKRISLMIEAMKYVKGNIKLKIAGKGPEEGNLKRLASGDERIQFLGFASDDEVKKLYSNALTVLFVPYDEDYGFITIEAMMSKKPVITCVDSGGPREFIKQGVNGFIVRPDPKEIAEKIEILIENKSKAREMGEKAYKSVQGITWEAVVSGLLNEHVKKSAINIHSRKRKKITVTSHFSIYPPRGGGQSRIFNLYKNVSKEFDVEVVCMGNYNERESRREISKGLVETVVPKTIAQAEKEWEYEKEVEIPVSDSVLPLVSHLTPEYGIRLRNSISESDIVVVSHPYLLHEIEKYRGEKLLIYEAHNIEYNLKKAAYKNKNKTTNDILNLIYEVEREACLKSKFILTCSEEDKNILSKMYDVPTRKFIVVPNGVDCNEIEFVPWDKRIDNKKKVGLKEEYTAIFIGSWHPPNIEACGHVINIAKKVPQIKFLIIGSVCLALKDYKLPKNVGLIGVVSDKEKKLIYSIADVALNPMTSGSGTNLKMFDYMAAGIPVITTEFGARGINSNAISHIFIAEVEKTHEILNNLYNNTYNEIETKVANARKVVEENFDWRVISKKVISSLQI